MFTLESSDQKAFIVVLSVLVELLCIKPLSALFLCANRKTIDVSVEILLLAGIPIKACSTATIFCTTAAAAFP